MQQRIGSRGVAIVLAVGLAFATTPAPAQQPYPSQTIKIIVGVAAGGLGDIASRLVAKTLSEAGHTAIVENRTGANGIIATEAVAKAPADGHTLISSNHATFAILPHMTKLPYNAVKDFTPITLAVAAPNVLIVKSSLPVKSVAELIAYGKANPGKLTNASQGVGASGHLLGEQFKQITGVDLVHVHYRGAALALQDVVAGHMDVMFDVVPLTREHAQAGRVRALAVASPQRNPVLPDVPTMVEVGLQPLEGGAWFGFMAPAGTPKATIAWLDTQIRKTFETPAVRERLTKNGLLLLSQASPEAFAAFMAKDSARWEGVIRQGNIKLDSR
ncbi:MAG: tripartite tricarboxylate transporter substrate binding protein [Rhizobiales bacterium]|nr:tripartite tricarboxylate transporter substrate binding protein [Hyphomicrobiales bacterium]